MIFRKGNEMWDAIKYCIYCLGIIISSAFGYNPEGLTWKTGVIGVVTCIVVLSVIYCIAWLVRLWLINLGEVHSSSLCSKIS